MADDNNIEARGPPANPMPAKRFPAATGFFDTSAKRLPGQIRRSQTQIRQHFLAGTPNDDANSSADRALWRFATVAMPPWLRGRDFPAAVGPDQRAALDGGEPDPKASIGRGRANVGWNLATLAKLMEG